MRNLKLLLEYDGTNFNGWQKQKDKRTVALCPAATKILLEMKQEIIEFCKAHKLVFDEKTTRLFTLCNKKEGRNTN